MSSLAAVQADGFYYPTDFDPQKHKSLNGYHGTHALRERAAKISQGILVIRFEIPFHVWCSKCGEKIAKGERFNADKKAIGMYHSTKIWQFSMRHHCGCIITIQSDPKNTEYIVVEGAKRKVEGLERDDDEGILDLPDDDEKVRLERDAIYRLERGEENKKRAKTAAEEVAELLMDAHDKHSDPYATNARLRAQLRVKRREGEQLEKERKALNLPEHVQLLPSHEDDDLTAQLAFYAHDAVGNTHVAQQNAKRQAIMTQAIFKSKHSVLTQGELHHLQQRQQQFKSHHQRHTPAGFTADFMQRHKDDSRALPDVHQARRAQDVQQGKNDRGRNAALHHRQYGNEGRHRSRSADMDDDVQQQELRRKRVRLGHQAAVADLQRKAHSTAGASKQLHHTDEAQAAEARRNLDRSSSEGIEEQISGSGIMRANGEHDQDTAEDGAKAPADKPGNNSNEPGSSDKQLVSLKPAAQPGAASGVADGSTAAAQIVRAEKLKTVHQSAKSSVAAWCASRTARKAAAAEKASHAGVGLRGEETTGSRTTVGKTPKNEKALIRSKALGLAARRQMPQTTLNGLSFKGLQGF